MAKVVDITEKLNFEEQPEIVIKGTHIKVNNDAETMLKIMGNFTEKDSDEAVIASISLLFPEKEKKKLDKLKLSFKDLMTVVTVAMNLVQGEEKEQGEQ